MTDGELQVLGKRRKLSKREICLISIVGIVLLVLLVALGIAAHRYFSPEQTRKYRTGEKMGESTIVSDLQTTVDSLLVAKLTEIGGLQGQDENVTSKESSNLVRILPISRSWDH